MRPLRHPLAIAILALAFPAGSVTVAQGLEEVRPLRVRIQMQEAVGGARFSGKATRPTEDTVQLVSGSHVRLLSVQDIYLIEAYRGTYAGEGALLGAVGGGLAGFFTATLIDNPPGGCDDSEDVYCGSFLDAARDVGIGAAAGAVIGVVTGLVIPKWENIGVLDVQLLPALPDGRPGIALVVRRHGRD